MPHKMSALRHKLKGQAMHIYMNNPAKRTEKKMITFQSFQTSEICFKRHTKKPSVQNLLTLSCRPCDIFPTVPHFHDANRVLP